MRLSKSEKSSGNSGLCVSSDPAIIRREYNPEFVNAICNHSSVLPIIDYREFKGDCVDMGPIMGPSVLTHVLWFSNGRDAAGCASWTSNHHLGERRVWQVDLYCLDTCRGRRALDTAAAMLAVMRPHCDMLWCAVPIANKAARWLAGHLGFAVSERQEWTGYGLVDVMELHV